MNLVEDGDHRTLDDLIFQCGDPERTFPSVGFLDVHPSRWLYGTHRDAAGGASRPADPPARFHTPAMLSHPRRVQLAFQRAKAVPQQIDRDMVEQSGELHLLVFPCCFPHTRPPL